MPLSLVSVAMQLSGLEAAHFTGGDSVVRWVYEEGARKLRHCGSSPSPSSISTASSSGFNSWPEDQHKEDFAQTSGTSGTSGTSARCASVEYVTKNEPITMYQARDLLDLASNIRNQGWNYIPAELPKDPQNFFQNRSQYSRVKGDYVPLHIDVACEFCGFVVSHFD